MDHHIDTSKADHDILLLTSVKQLKQNSQQKDLEIAQLREWNTKKDETINVMKQDFQDLKNQFKQQNMQIQRYQEEEKQKSKKIEAFQTQQSKRDDQHKENIANLQKFAEIISDLHLTLSQPSLKRNYIHKFTLFKESYEKEGVVMKWNTIVNEVNRDKIVNCDYLEKLKDSINQYNQTVYSPIYKERFLNLFFTLPLGYSYPFVRIACESFCHFICVKSGFNLNDFDEEVRRNNERRYCKILNDQHTFSYYDSLTTQFQQS